MDRARGPECQTESKSSASRQAWETVVASQALHGEVRKRAAESPIGAPSISSAAALLGVGIGDGRAAVLRQGPRGPAPRIRVASGTR